MKAIALVLLVAAACQAPRGAPTPMPQWLFGDWTGLRHDAVDNTAPMHYSVTPILGGAAFTETFAIQTPPHDYQGFAVVALERGTQRWAMQYVNSVRGTFARLDSADDFVFRSVQPQRTEDSELTYSRREDGGLWRTMRVRPVAGGEWRLLWRDELHRLPK
jgi:hypothetical protein